MRQYRPFQPPALQQDRQNSGYRYREYLPSAGLADFVACYWTVEVQVTEKKVRHRIIPDSCVDIIFDLQASSVSKGAFVVGLMPEYNVMHLSRLSFFGIRFYAETAHHVLGDHVSALKGNRVYLQDVWGGSGMRAMEEVFTAGHTAAIIQKVESILKKRFVSADQKPSSLLQKGIQYIHARRGNVDIRSLAGELGSSERNMRRTFQQALGMSPKALSNIVRFQYVLRDLLNDSKQSLVDIALNYGYYDQSHFINSFKRFYGLPPTRIFLNGEHKNK